MEFLAQFLPIVLYIAVIALVVVLIVFVLRAIETLNRVNHLADDVSHKLTTLNGIFDCIDIVTDKVSMISDTLINTVATVIGKVFKRKRKEIDEENGEEE